MMSARRLIPNLPLMVLIIIGVLAGLWAGAQRLGWALPELHPALAGIHGALMISGVLGTLTGLERAVALAAQPGTPRRALFIPPVLNGFGTLALLIGGASPMAHGLLAAGSFGVVLMFARAMRRHLAAHTVMMAAGVVMLFAGNLLWWADLPVYRAVHWWMAFLVLTIVGERLELARIARISPRSRQMLITMVIAYIAGVALVLIAPEIGVRLAGLSMIGLALWLLRCDVARQSIRRAGLPRFVAWCLIVGYVWLLIGGVFGLVWGDVRAGFTYDALIHSILLGFVFSMIFGHAPIIFPSITGIQVDFHRSFYAYLALLHISLVIRITADLTSSFTLRMWGGLFNIIAVLLFFVVFGASVVLARRRSTPKQVAAYR